MRTMHMLHKGLLIVAALCLAATSASGGEVQIWHYNTSGYNITSALYLKNVPGASEERDGADASFLESPYTNALEIYTMVEGVKRSSDAHPVDTLGWDFSLGVKGHVSYAGTLMLFVIEDSTDLSDKTMWAYDVSAPQTQYEVPSGGDYPVLTAEEFMSLYNDGDPTYATNWVLFSAGGYKLVTMIDLPNLVDQGAGPYAQWRLDVVPVPEPATMSLLALGGLAVLKRRKSQIRRGGK